MEQLTSNISYFKNCRTRKPLKANVSAALQWIKNGSSKEIIEQVRSANDQRTKDLIKQKLPAVTFGGHFKDRSTLVQASGVACLDFDKVGGLDALKSSLKASQYIFSCWISPSGNGIKALVKIPVVKSKREYQSYYKGILGHFKELQPDIATKDINRIFFESYDPDLYLNEKAKVFERKAQVKEYSSPALYPDSNLSEGKIVDRIISWWMKKYSFSKGNRNNSLFVLACALSNSGVSKNPTEDLFYSFEDEDFHYSEIQQIINSAYKKADFNSQSLPQ